MTTRACLNLNNRCINRIVFLMLNQRRHENGANLGLGLLFGRKCGIILWETQSSNPYKNWLHIVIAAVCSKFCIVGSLNEFGHLSVV